MSVGSSLQLLVALALFFGQLTMVAHSPRISGVITPKLVGAELAASG